MSPGLLGTTRLARLLSGLRRLVHHPHSRWAQALSLLTARAWGQRLFTDDAQVQELAHARRIANKLQTLVPSTGFPDPSYRGQRLFVPREFNRLPVRLPLVAADVLGRSLQDAWQRLRPGQLTPLPRGGGLYWHVHPASGRHHLFVYQHGTGLERREAIELELSADRSQVLVVNVCGKAAAAAQLNDAIGRGWLLAGLREAIAARQAPGRSSAAAPPFDGGDTRGMPDGSPPAEVPHKPGPLPDPQGPRSRL